MISFFRQLLAAILSLVTCIPIYGFPVGNRKQIASTLAPVPAGLFNYDANDRFTAGDTEACPERSRRDNDGNTVSSGGIANVYDFENHLIQKGGVTLVYDGDGSRVSKTVAGVTTTYLVDSLNLTGYSQVVYETYSGSSAPNRELNHVYVYGLELLGQTRNYVANSQSNTQQVYYDYDGHGSVRALTDPNGSVTDTYDYDAFGNRIHSTGTTPNDCLFAGEQFDPDLNLYYNRARYLAVSTGRFWTMDSFEGSQFSPASLHKYLYASADTVNRVDPGGHEDADLTSNLVSTAGITIIRSIAVVSAVAAICSVDYALGGDVCINRRSQREGRMRIQLQLGRTFTVPGTPVLKNADPPGVTILQVVGGLETLHAIAKSATARFPFNRLEIDLLEAEAEVSAQAGRFVPFGYSGFYRGLLTALIGDSAWRIDVDNLEGTNLRQ